MMMPMLAVHMAVGELFRGCRADFQDRYVEVQCLARQWMIGVHSDMFRIHRGHRYRMFTVFSLRIKAHSRLDLVFGIEHFAWHFVTQGFVTQAVTLLGRYAHFDRISRVL